MSCSHTFEQGRVGVWFGNVELPKIRILCYMYICACTCMKLKQAFVIYLLQVIWPNSFSVFTGERISNLCFASVFLLLAAVSHNSMSLVNCEGSKARKQKFLYVCKSTYTALLLLVSMSDMCILIIPNAFMWFILHSNRKAADVKFYCCMRCTRLYFVICLIYAVPIMFIIGGLR